jgi:hypothetical protein
MSVAIDSGVLVDADAVALLDDVSPGGRRRRGPSKVKADGTKNWQRPDQVAVIPLELDVSGDQVARTRLEKQWSAAFTLERAIKAEARTKCVIFDEWKDGHAYQAMSKGERPVAAKQMRQRLGLTPEALTASAYAHIEDSGWMRDHLTKAQACHHAAAVWATTKRHLFPDVTGDYFGLPDVGSWWDFTRMVGRARSHTKTQPVWETFRLVGTLGGHVRAFETQHSAGLSVTELAQAAPGLTGKSLLDQPSSMPAPVKPERRAGGWWFYTGPLAVVFTGLPKGELILPVRLPAGAGDFPRLAHFLADPALWHKIDLVRVRDRKAPGGWRYYAHLTVLVPAYQAPSTVTRRASVDTYRLAGIDANVSNLAAVSMPSHILKSLDDDSLRVTIIKPSPRMEQATADGARKVARASAKLDRSRRASNPDQYDLSKPQESRAQRRQDAGLPERMVQVRGGRRDSNVKGVPKRAYRKDTLTNAYRATRMDKACLQAAAATRKDHTARQIAADLVAAHGNRWVTEDVDIAAWQHTWGARMAVTTPGRIMAALEREITATGGTMHRASTANTWLSQRCLCGRREKKPLSQRWHSCTCGLQADRDVLAAALATTIVFTNPDQPSTARVDNTLLGVLARRVAAQQEGQVRSTITLAFPGGDSSPQPMWASAGRNDSHGQPRNRQARKGPPRRRRKGQHAHDTTVSEL